MCCFVHALDVIKLKSLLKLRTLTLHGNSISRLVNYRSLVLFYLLQIKSLDFSLITHRERSVASPKPVANNFFISLLYNNSCFICNNILLSVNLLLSTVQIIDETTILSRRLITEQCLLLICGR